MVGQTTQASLRGIQESVITKSPETRPLVASYT